MALWWSPHEDKREENEEGQIEKVEEGSWGEGCGNTVGLVGEGRVDKGGWGQIVMSKKIDLMVLWCTVWYE